MKYDVCGVSGFYNHGVVQRLNAETNITRFPAVSIGSGVHRQAKLNIDQGKGTAEWITPMGTTTTTLPASPFWLVYCDGVEGASAEIMTPRQLKPSDDDEIVLC